MAAPPSRPGPHRSGRRRRALAAAAFALVAVTATAIAAARLPAVPAPTTSPSAVSAPPASGSVAPPATPGGDRSPLPPDGAVSSGELWHDSRDDLYRSPAGAVAAGTEVALRLRAAAGDLSAAVVRLRLGSAGALDERVVPMAVVAVDPAGGLNGYAYWEARIRTDRTGTLRYRFEVRDGGTTRLVEDDRHLDGGPGEVLGASAGRSWRITVHQATLDPPRWMQGAVVYRVVPDRFLNGDPGNDPSSADTPAVEGPGRFRHGDVYGRPVQVRRWDERPEGACRHHAPPARCDEDPSGRDFYGGDLAGIAQRIDRLADLGVSALQLAPVFAAPSNDGSDPSDLRSVDPGLGTHADLEALVSAARAAGIRVLLELPLGALSTDSPSFDRYRRFPEVGACESRSSPYRSWFTFRVPGAADPAVCEASDPSGRDVGYLPGRHPATAAVRPADAVKQMLLDERDGILSTWLRSGVAGWVVLPGGPAADRPDASEAGGAAAPASGAELRDVVERSGLDAVLLDGSGSDVPVGTTDAGWEDGLDGGADDRFRRAALGFVGGATLTAEPVEGDGSARGLEALTPSEFVAEMASLVEDTPGGTAGLRIDRVDTDGSARALWVLTPGPDLPAVKESAGGLSVGKTRLRLLAALQLTWPGVASISYGDEVGLTGHVGADALRPYPWGAEDGQLRLFYRRLIHARRDHEALRTGSLRILLADDASGVVAFARRSPADAVITVLNVSDEQRIIRVPTAGLVPDGSALEAIAGDAPGPVAAGAVAVTVQARSAAVLAAVPGTDLAPPASVTGVRARSSAEARGGIDVSWSPVDGAARYRVLRSLVPDGGFVPVGETDRTDHVDASASAAVRYHYRVEALDAAGNAAPASELAVVDADERR